MTNGLLINEEWAEKIAAHSLFVCVSLNAATKKTHEFVNRGSKWEVVLRNIQRVRFAKESLRSDVRILGNMTFIKESIDEIPLFIETFGKLGFDEIQFISTDSAQSYLFFHPLEKKALKMKIREALRRSRDPSKINTHELKQLGLW